jgi:hypothetical protein
MEGNVGKHLYGLEKLEFSVKEETIKKLRGETQARGNINTAAKSYYLEREEFL